MLFRKAIVAALAVSMSSAPVLAQSAAPLSIASSASRAGAVTEGANNLDNEYLLPALVIIAVLAAAILLSKDNKTPTSP
jgi:hypothetical protein